MSTTVEAQLRALSDHVSEIERRVAWVETELENRGKRLGELAATLRKDTKTLRRQVERILKWVSGDALENQVGASEELRDLRQRIDRIQEQVDRLQAIGGTDFDRQCSALRADVSALQEELRAMAEVPEVAEVVVPEQTIDVELQRSRLERREAWDRWLREGLTNPVRWLLGGLTLVLVFWLAARAGVLGEVIQHLLGGG